MGAFAQVVTDDIEVDAFRRCRRDIGILARTTERILHVWIWLRARIAKPITKIAARVLIETDNVDDAAVDGKIARTGRGDVSNASRRPTEQILRSEIVAGGV